jgi:flagellar protein FliO/FliZ
VSTVKVLQAHSENSGMNALRLQLAESIVPSLLAAPVWAAERASPGEAATGVAFGHGGEIGSLTQVTGALLLVVIGILAVVWVLRRLSRLPSGGSGGLRVVGGLALGTRERILLVEVGETQLLVGVTPGQLKTLHVLDKPLIAPGATVGSPLSFAQRLGKALQGGQMQ